MGDYGEYVSLWSYSLHSHLLRQLHKNLNHKKQTITYVDYFVNYSHLIGFDCEDSYYSFD